MHGKHVSFELPRHNPHHDGRLARTARTILHRAGQLATKSALIFTAIGTACLLSGVLSLLWYAHPLTLHVISMRSLLMVSTWVFLGCLVYNRIEPNGLWRISGIFFISNCKLLVHRIALAIARESLSDLRSLYRAMLSLIFKVHTSASVNFVSRKSFQYIEKGKKRIILDQEWHVMGFQKAGSPLHFL